MAAGFLVLYFSLLDCIMLASRNPMHHHHHLCIKRVKVGISAMLAQFLVKEHFFGAFEFWLHTGRQRKKCLKISNYIKRESKGFKSKMVDRLKKLERLESFAKE